MTENFVFKIKFSWKTFKFSVFLIMVCRNKYLTIHHFNWILIKCFLETTTTLMPVFWNVNDYCINSPTQLFSLIYLYFCLNHTIDWVECIFNVFAINDCFCVYVWIKGAILCFIFVYYYFNFKTRAIVILSPLKLVSNFALV